MEHFNKQTNKLTNKQTNKQTNRLSNRVLSKVFDKTNKRDVRDTLISLVEGDVIEDMISVTFHVKVTVHAGLHPVVITGWLNEIR